jgi:hypothetical protein
MNNCKIAIYYAFFTSVVIILFIKKLSFLDKKIDKGVLKGSKLTLWSISHFITFFIIGKLCPNNYVFFFLLGVCWEIFETIYGTYKKDIQYWTGNGIDGQINDIIMNTLGYHFAHIINTNIKLF